MESAPITVEHPQLYFRDGNIILRASNEVTKANAVEHHSVIRSSTNSAGHTLFRVHKGVLSHHSGTFSSMLGIPLPEEREVIDDCDVVDLHDSVADIEKLLKIIYGLAPTYQRLHWASFCYYAPIIPLADKYEMTDIRKKYLARILDGWPRNLTEWDAFEAELDALRQMARGFNERRNPEPWFLGYMPGPAKINPENEIDYTRRDLDDILVVPDHFIRFAEDNLQHDVLPGAYYHISRIPYIENDNGDPDFWTFFFFSGGLQTGYEKLQFSHLRRLYVGKNRLQREYLGMTNSPWLYYLNNPWPEAHKVLSSRTDDVGDADVDTPFCDPKEWWIRHVRGVALDAVVQSDGDILKHILNLKKVIEELATGSTGSGICGACWRRVQSTFPSMRSYIWDRLPDYFGHD